MNRLRWWHWLPWPSWRLVAIVEAADQVPLRVPRNCVVLVGSRERPKWLAFDCPCRTGHRIMVNVDASHSPRWHLVSEKSLTVWPSVDCRRPERRCHYFIKRGRVVWVPDKERKR